MRFRKKRVSKAQIEMLDQVRVLHSNHRRLCQSQRVIEEVDPESLTRTFEMQISFDLKWLIKILSKSFENQICIQFNTM